VFSNYKRINSNKYNKQNWIWKKKRKCHWYRLKRPTGTKEAATLAASLVLVGLSNQYQWKPKAPVENPVS